MRALLGILVLSLVANASWQTHELPNEGCQDNLKSCPKLGELLFTLEGTCRYPAAELCQKTCGECARVREARQCKSPRYSCEHPFCSSKVDWDQLFTSMMERSEHLGGRLLARQPMTLEIPRFLSNAEADQLASIAEDVGFEQEDSLPRKVRDVKKIDCESDSCLLNPFISELYHRVSDLLRISARNFESFEFLSYGPGQHYKAHLDAMALPEVEPQEVGCGPRVLTVFFYLSDVIAGGATRFPKANLSVTPEKGKVIVWLNVKKQDMWLPSNYAAHTAMPVRKGRKIAANFWVHPFDYRTPEKNSPEWC